MIMTESKKRESDTVGISYPYGAHLPCHEEVIFYVGFYG